MPFVFANFEGFGKVLGDDPDVTDGGILGFIIPRLNRHGGQTVENFAGADFGKILIGVAITERVPRAAAARKLRSSRRGSVSINGRHKTRATRGTNGKFIDRRGNEIDCLRTAVSPYEGTAVGSLGAIARRETVHALRGV